jgi:hypothetical protein
MMQQPWNSGCTRECLVRHRVVRCIAQRRLPEIVNKWKDQHVSKLSCSNREAASVARQNEPDVGALRQP